MSKVLTVYNLTGEKKGTFSVPPLLASADAKPTTVHQVVNSLLSNLRRPIAHTKTRGNVRGGGRKPWRQKGTGRARAGTIRSPLWRGGGIVFGPLKERNFKAKIPQKISRKVRLFLIADKLKEEKLLIISKLAFKEFKTQKLLALLSRLPIKEGTILLLVNEKNPYLIKSAANLPFLRVILSPNLNSLDLMRYDYLVAEKEALEKVLK